jgi:hypothetical protein
MCEINPWELKIAISLMLSGHNHHYSLHIKWIVPKKETRSRCQVWPAGFLPEVWAEIGLRLGKARERGSSELVQRCRSGCVVVRNHLLEVREIKANVRTSVSPPPHPCAYVCHYFKVHLFFLRIAFWGWGCGLVVECLPVMCKAFCSFPALQKWNEIIK